MDGLRDYFPPVLLEHFQHQSIFVERNPRRWLDGNTDLDNVRLARTEYSVGRIENRRLQRCGCPFRVLGS
jgi:hypothetical protein